MSNEEFEQWMNKLWTKMESLEKRIDQLLNRQNVLNGEILLDNQDLCFQLKVSKRSLQRYRSEGKLKYKQIEQKTYYFKSDWEIMPEPMANTLKSGNYMALRYLSKLRIARKNARCLRITASLSREKEISNILITMGILLQTRYWLRQTS